MARCDFCGNELSDAQYLLVNDAVYKSCPDCSKEVGQHMHYFCPDAFGITPKRMTTNNPMGLQSHCAKCRSNKKGPHADAFPCSEVKEKEGYIIPEIRFLPMSKDVFATYDDAKEFILNTMPNRGGIYYYIKSKMNCLENSFVLFQYDGSLIGYAVYLETVELEEPLVFSDGKQYNGYYQFAPNTIRVLNKPIDDVQFSAIDQTFAGFSRSLQRKPVGLLPAIFQLFDGSAGYIKAKEVDVTIPEEIQLDNLHEGAKKQITVNAYERNKKARQACINYYRKKNGGRIKCEICGFDFGEVYGEEFMGVIHVHHLVEISSIGNEYKVDAIKDLIPICPNCHAIVHSKKEPYTPDEIRAMLKND